MKKIFAALSLMLALSACNDHFMERYPLDEVSDVSFWKSVNDLELYVNNFYPRYIFGHGYGWSDASDFRGSNESFFAYGDVITDNMAPGSYNRTSAGQLIQPSAAGSGNWSWTNVRELNIYLTNHDKVVAGSPAELKRKQNLLGEIQLFKAMEYFEKMKAFGEVPWYDAVIGTDSPDLYAEQKSRVEVGDKIVALLDEAIKNLPAKGEEVLGRINQDVVTHYKARVCLHEGTFRKYHGIAGATELLKQAAQAANVLIASNRYSISAIGTDPYNYMFRQYDYSSNPEVILQKEYKLDIFGHATARYWATNGRWSVGATKSLVDEYLCADGRTMHQHNRVNEYVKEELTNRDPRLTQTVCLPGANYVWKELRNWEQRPLLNGMTAGDAAQGFSSTGYWIIKWYLDDKVEWERTTNGLMACPIFRYAETLLIYAEAQAELGLCDQAVLDLTINKLRDRVAMPHLTIGNYPDDPALKAKYTAFCDYMPSDLLLEIRRERRVELAVENFRYDDLMRWKAGRFLTQTIEGIRWKASDYYAYNDKGELQKNTDGTPKMAVVASPDITTSGATVFYNPTTERILPYAKTMAGIDRKFENYMYVFPIPTEDLVLNPDLKSPWPAK